MLPPLIMPVKSSLLSSAVNKFQEEMLVGVWDGVVMSKKQSDPHAGMDMLLEQVQKERRAADAIEAFGWKQEQT